MLNNGTTGPLHTQLVTGEFSTCLLLPFCRQTFPSLTIWRPREDGGGVHSRSQFSSYLGGWPQSLLCEDHRFIPCRQLWCCLPINQFLREHTLEIWRAYWSVHFATLSLNTLLLAIREDISPRRIFPLKIHFYLTIVWVIPRIRVDLRRAR